MAIIFNIAEAQEPAVQYIADTVMQDTVIIIRAPRLSTIPEQAAPANSIVAFPRKADEDELITWEDAECL